MNDAIEKFIEDTRRAWHIREELELCAAGNEQHFTCSDLLLVVRRAVKHGLSLAFEAKVDCGVCDDCDEEWPGGSCDCDCEHNHREDDKNSAISEILKSLEV